MPLLLEVCIESVADALAAERGGADRLEVCSALDLGGLTPSLGQYQAVRAAVALPLWVMIRPRSGDFVYSPAEVDVMRRDIEGYRTLEPAGFVLGILSDNGRVNAEPCRMLLKACGNLPVVFHRAFDRTPDLMATVDTLVGLGFRRILTSGREPTAIAGAPLIKLVVAHAEGRIEILPCGRIRADDIVAIVQTTGCDQVHGSFAEPVEPGAGRGLRGYPERSQTSEARVAAARRVLDRGTP